MKLITFLFAFFVLNGGCASAQKKCTCETILKSKNQSYKVYSKNNENSKILYTIDNDSINENYFVIELHTIKNQWGLITAYSPSTKYKNKGWIKIAHLEVFPSDYSEPLFFYDSPKISASKKEVEEYDFYSLDILDCENDWLKVKYTVSKNTFIGWLPKNNQCANPYTTCN